MSDGGREDTLALFDADEEPRFGKPEDFEDILLALWIQLGHKYYLPQTNSKVQLCFQLIPSAFVPYLDTLISLSSDPRSHKKFIRLFRYITNFEIFDTIPRADRRDGTVSANALREHSSVTEAVLKEPGVKEAVLKDAGAKETGVKETDPRKKVNYTPARESSKPEGGKSEPQSVPSTRDPGSQDECGTFSEALRSKCTSWSKRSSEAAGPSWRVSGPDFEGPDFENLDFENLDFENLDFENLDFENLDFEDLDPESGQKPGRNLRTALRTFIVLLRRRFIEVSCSQWPVRLA
ncbi:hypothetical protein GNI_052700 [Gregarina niphandrodes]|uniref:Uncharacterized protein n=1 Tax=Gregarina niphandrodes TaxID=110365 RepID=A0A023B989_GRENI|nr:hypothetical protein GNI_052700 [Gregarina niphandrodes]EZG71441.1 hypothetical protein GNI_052700 [Gregarina niphandrodes]|eukprot:XP_011129826.1 hypothetical protein GNI_052700 [Gregarina niphandrodes]